MPAQLVLGAPPELEPALPPEAIPPVAGVPAVLGVPPVAGVPAMLLVPPAARLPALPAVASVPAAVLPVVPELLSPLLLHANAAPQVSKQSAIE
jgi:hypothetical protein